MKEMMKDSGIEWIWVIPEEWEVHPLYFYFFERNNKNLLEKEKNLLSLSYGRIIRKDIETWEGLLPENFKNYNTIEKDDIVIRPTDLQNDQRSLRTGIARERGIITSVYITLAKKRALVPSYFHYLLHSYDLCKVFYEMGGGVRQALRYAELSKLPALEPPLTEQRSIASFLDSACAKIDGIIADLEHQVDLLKEYKKSLITETVTKGLDKHVKLKDSGITWIGKIPEHWEIVPFKYVFKTSTGLNITKADLSENGNAVINYGQIHSEENITTSLLPKLLRHVPYDIKVQNCALLSKGDVVFADTSEDYAGVGNCVCIQHDSDLIYAGYHTIIAKPTIDLYSPFFAYLFTTDIWRQQLRKSVWGVKVFSITQSKIRQTLLLLPPTNEQQTIADFLDTRCAEIDTIIKSKEKQIKQQKEYKKSLIYEYVTGKKRVKKVY